MCGTRFFPHPLRPFEFGVPFVRVQKALELVSTERFYLPINFWEWITIFGTGFVQVFKVDAHSPTSITFLYENRV